MRCPTREETLAAVLALLPRGRAWQSNIGGPEPYRDAPFDPAAFDPETFDTDSRPGSVMFRFWSAVATVFDYAHQRLCALALEMFCATASELRDQWMIEYGLPDPCDPFPDLCAKVSAIGGTRCEYYAAVAARAGWSVQCENTAIACGGQMGCSRMGVGQMGAQRANVLRLIVSPADSPSFTGRMQTPPLMGRLMMGQPIACEPDISPLQCVIERIVHAEVEIEYVILN